MPARFTHPLLTLSPAPLFLCECQSANLIPSNASQNQGGVRLRDRLLITRHATVWEQVTRVQPRTSLSAPNPVDQHLRDTAPGLAPQPILTATPLTPPLRSLWTNSPLRKQPPLKCNAQGEL
jgi:hypothetical protein